MSITKWIKNLFAKQYQFETWEVFQAKSKFEELFNFQQNCRQNNVDLIGTEDENPQPIGFFEAS